MYIKKPELKIDPADPFSTDKLKRKESAEILTQLLSVVDGPFVLSVDSPWGTGKTTFVKMWEQHLKNLGFRCLYFNAWESDYNADPLIPLIGEIQAEIVTQLDDSKSKAREYFNKAKRVSSSLVRRAIPVAAKIATAGVLDLDEVTEDAISDLISESAKAKINSYEADKQTIKEFKKSLENFAQELRKDSGKPVVFFVDELDRCRPSYAVELLERAKHLFNVSGIVFVLAIDRHQIYHSVEALYGIGMKVDGYLRRFIDLEYQLPQASAKDFCAFLFAQFGFDETFRRRRSYGEDESGELLETFRQLSEIFGFSLRVVEQCFTQLSLSLRTTPDDRLIFPQFLVFLIALKAANRDLYNQFTKDATSSQQVIDFIKEQPGGVEFLSDGYGVRLEAYIVSAHADSHEITRLAIEYNDKAKAAALDSDGERYSTIARILERLGIIREINLIDYLSKKVEILERFDVTSEQQN